MTIGCLGGTGNDSLYGEAGHDVLSGGKGRDYLDGGLDNDALFGDEGRDTLYAGEGDDYAEGGAGRDLVDGGAGHDVLKGGSGNDTLLGQDGHDILEGEAGHDKLIGGAGNDYWVSGGTGNDSLYGEAGHDVLSGDEGRDLIYGGTGNDVVLGGAGRDRLYGGEGEDIIVGNEGADRLYGDAGHDILNGGAGNDTIYGGTGNDIIDGGAEDVIAPRNLVANGSFEDNQLGNRNWGVFGSIEGWTTTQGKGIEVQQFGKADDGKARIELDSHNNSGMMQNLDTEAGKTYEISFAYTPRPGVAETSNPIEVYWNGELLDTITGASKTEAWKTYTYTVEAGEGETTALEFRAAGKDDSLGGYLDDVTVFESVSATRNDLLFGGEGDDIVLGNNGNDRLSGNQGNDILEGGFGNDTLIGGAGNDILVGVDPNAGFGQGSVDVLTGGAGEDHFILGNAEVFYNDGDDQLAGTNDFAMITDFNAQEDKIQLAGSAADYVLGSTAQGVNLYLDTNQDGQLGGSDELIATISGVSQLSLTDSSFYYASPVVAF